jgi:hypothetical protein
LSDDHVVEFDCSDCGRHIISLTGPAPFNICAACMALPGWFHDPNLARILDPDHIHNEDKK